MKTVWVVSEGDYSDYKILCLFETRELAEEHVKVRRGMEGDYSSVNDPEAKQMFDVQPSYARVWRCRSYAGTGWNTILEEETWWPYEGHEGDPTQPIVMAMSHPYPSGDGGWVDVIGADREAVHVEAERRVHELGG